MKKINKNNKYNKLHPDRFLPKKLIDKISADIFNNYSYGYKTKNNFLHCLALIYHHQIEEFHSLTYYVPLGANYWKEVLKNHDYKSVVINPLIEMGFIEYRSYGSRNIPDKKVKTETNANKPVNAIAIPFDSDKEIKKGRVVVRYRINPDLTNDDEYVSICYLNKNKLNILNIPDPSCPELSNINDLNISIDKPKANYWLETHAEQIYNEYLHLGYADKFPNDFTIKYHLYLAGGSYDTKYCTIKAAKLIAESFGNQLFFYKNDFYIADLEEFKQQRVEHILHYYKREISKIGVIPLIDDRSETNMRLLNHLVSFPSKILQFICINNEPLIQFDLRTSQFLLFANILNFYLNKGETELMKLFQNEKTTIYLKKMIIAIQKHQHALPKTGIDINEDTSQIYSSDVLRFINDVFNTDFYKVVQHQLNLPDRAVAKLVLFKLLFSKSNRSDVLLNKLKGHYPTVLKIIASFKHLSESGTKSKNQDTSSTVNDDNNFSVFLQCVESEIYIDNILLPLRQQGIPCFSRHDSICTIAGHQKFVEEFIKNVFANLGFKYNDKVEDMFWLVFDYYEHRDSEFMDDLIDKSTIEDVLDEVAGYIEIYETKREVRYNSSDHNIDTDSNPNTDINPSALSTVDVKPVKLNDEPKRHEESSSSSSLSSVSTSTLSSHQISSIYSSVGSMPLLTQLVIDHTNIINGNPYLSNYFNERNTNLLVDAYKIYYNKFSINSSRISIEEFEICQLYKFVYTDVIMHGKLNIIDFDTLNNYIDKEKFKYFDLETNEKIQAYKSLPVIKSIIPQYVQGYSGKQVKLICKKNQKK